MRRETKRRGALYGGAIGAAALLLFLGFGVTVPPDLGTRLSGAAMLAGFGSHDEALAEIDLALEEHPDSFEALIYRASILSRAERYDEALAAYDRALAHADASGSIERSLRQDRASVLLALDRTEEFRAERDRLAAGGVDGIVHSLDAIGAIHRDDWKAAAGHWEAAFRADSNDVTRSHLHATHVELGRRAIKERRFEDALRRFERACELIPAIKQPFLESANVCLAADDADGALASLGACPDGTPGVAPLRFRAATMLLAAGRTDDAWSALEAAYRCDAAATRTLLDAETAWNGKGAAEHLASLNGQ